MKTRRVKGIVRRVRQGEEFDVANESYRMDAIRLVRFRGYKDWLVVVSCYE